MSEQADLMAASPELRKLAVAIRALRVIKAGRREPSATTAADALDKITAIAEDEMAEEES